MYSTTSELMKDSCFQTSRIKFMFHVSLYIDVTVIVLILIKKQTLITCQLHYAFLQALIKQVLVPYHVFNFLIFPL